jgi:thymidylate synthase ThyX
MESRPKFRAVPKIFRTVRIAFKVMMDYGAFRDLQRHRRCEQYVEPLTDSLGYLVPDDIKNSELEYEYRKAMDLVKTYDDENVMNDVDLMQYMVPLGYLHKSIFDMDLQQLYYMVELRTKPQGHISYRRVAYKMYELACEKFPSLMQWCRAVNPTEIGVHN